MSRIAIFASGAGTNAINIIKNFSESSLSVVRVYCNNSAAEIMRNAPRYEVPVTLFSRDDFYKSNVVLQQLHDEKIDIIVLAGFLWLIPPSIIFSFPQRIINIHPALLPKYGGKGMFGMNVHNAVIQNKESQSGITIHLVDEIYDNGKTLFQARCSIDAHDDAEVLAQKIHALEQAHFPRVISEYINSLPAE